MDAVCRCGRARLSRGCHLRESAPCLAHQAIAPAEASLSLLLRGLCSLARVLSPPLCCWSASTSCSVIKLALTPASNTPAPCPRSLFATLVTSRRRVHERRRREALASQGLPVRRLHQGTSSLLLFTRSGSRSVQSSFGNTSSPGRNHCLPLSRHQRLTPSCS